MQSQIISALRHGLRAMACLIGRHDPKPYRRLTQASREFRCIHCEKQFVDVRESWAPWMFRGAHPYGGPDGLGEALRTRGSRDPLVDQEPFASFTPLAKKS